MSISYSVGYSKEPEDPAKTLARAARDAVKAIKEHQRTFFETLDDKRPQPKDTQDALEQAQRVLQAAFARTDDRAAFAFELDFFFRLVGFVCSENPFHADDTVPLAVPAAKACIGVVQTPPTAESSAAQAHCQRIVDHLKRAIGS